MLQELGHELGHLVKYDKDEKTAENVGSKIDTIKPGEEKDYKEYLASIKDKYKDLPSLEESKVLENKIPDEYKEKIAVVDDIIIIGGLTVVGIAVWNYTQTPEFKESVRQEWIKLEAQLQKARTYQEFYALMVKKIMIAEGGVAPENIDIGVGLGEIGGILPLPENQPISQPTNTAHKDNKEVINPPNNLGEEGPPPPSPTNTAHETEKAEGLGTLVNEPSKVEDSNILYVKETNDEFLARIGNLGPNERVAKIKEKAAEVAKENGWGKPDRSILKANKGRTIYTDKEFYYSLDTLHGTFEVFNLKKKTI